MVSKKLDFDIIARDRASDKFQAVGKSADGASGKMKKFAAVGAAAAAAGAVMVGKALFDMTMAAAEDAKGQARLARALKNTTGATKAQVSGVEDWISAQGKALGVADDELRPAMENLARATGDVGEAQKLASLAMDVAAGTGKSLQTVSEGMMKAANGNVGALGRLGIATKDASGKTKTFDEITKDLSKTFGGQASTQANTMAGKMDRLKLMFDETKESIGARLLPVAERFATWMLTKAVPAIEKAATWLGEKMRPAMDSAKKAFADAQPFLALVGNVLKNVVAPAAKWIVEKSFPLLGMAAENMGRSLRAIGIAGTWMWNNALQPVFKLLAEAVSASMRHFGQMLQTLGKAPGMGWVGDLGDKLIGAAQKADRLADGIKKIPNRKDVTVSINYVENNKPKADPALNNFGFNVPKSNSRTGARPAPAGRLVGPAGRMAAGGAVGSISVRDLVDALTVALSATRLEVVGLDAGQQAYLRTGASY